jgi:hypothetical protein
MSEPASPADERSVLGLFERLPGNPIVTAGSDPAIGDNVNGPSVIRVPDWVPNRLGRYYLYFAHHIGDSIRLAYADDLNGPWTLHRPGVLALKHSLFDDHVASPDVHVDEANREIRLYYHGAYAPGKEYQYERLALSRDGLAFEPQPPILGGYYWRLFRWQDYWYGLVMPGRLVRSADGRRDFEFGPLLFDASMRHSAVHCVGDELLVFYSRAGDAPERILLSRIELRGDWRCWMRGPVVTVLEPERDYEGVTQPLAPSKRGEVFGQVRQLRDPGVLVEDGTLYLFYSTAGESGIAVAKASLADLLKV